MEITTEQNSGNVAEIGSDVGLGLPTCECGHCIDSLMGDDDVVVISQESLKVWLQGVCPGKAA